MNLKRTPFWAASIGCALILAGSPLACGGDGDDADTNSGGDAGSSGDDDSTTGGKGSASGGKGSTSGGKGSTSGGNENLGGDSATGGKDTTGAGGGGTTASATVADLIATLCEHEFDCCEDGESAYRFGSTAKDAEECTKDFTYQYAESNEASSPFPTLSGLLVTLGYGIDPSRVKENPKGIAECLAVQKALECPMLVETTPERVYCTPGADVGEDPCALDNLFSPKLTAGEECTLALGEAGGAKVKVAVTAGNDIECVVGTTCLSADDLSNSKDYDACVTRGLKGDSCTKDVDCDFNFFCQSGDCTEKGDAGDDCSFNDPDLPMPGDENAGCKGGLACSPVSLKCVPSCEADFPCSDNSQCPKGNSCRPMPIGDDSATWSLCQDIGASAADLCNDDDDCVAGRYCDGSVCQADNAIEDVCARDSMCEAGAYCTPYGCAALVQAGDVCDPSGGTNGGCVAKAKYCLSDTENSTPEAPTYLCATALRKAGEACAATDECQAGLKCEVTTADAVTWPWTCTAGAKVGRDCDADTATSDALSCGAGLNCNLDGKCEGQLDPGSDCEDPDAPGAARSDFCKNSTCVENWDEDGVDYICSDAPVPKTNGGDGLTCGQ